MDIDATEAFRTIRRDLDALVFALGNYIQVQRDTNEKVDRILAALERPDSGDNPLADALLALERAVRQVHEGQEQIANVQAMTLAELRARTRPSPGH